VWRRVWEQRLVRGPSTPLTWSRRPPWAAERYQHVQACLPRRGAGRCLCPGCKMVARGGGRRGCHVVRSSAPASLSDLYGWSRRTGAAERETARACARAEPSRAAAAQPSFSLTAFLCSVSPSCRAGRDLPEGCCGTGGPGTPGFSSASSSRRWSRRPPMRDAPGRSTAQGMGGREASGHGAGGPRPSPHGGASVARPQTWRELPADGR
jgi:hypothetical protein